SPRRNVEVAPCPTCKKGMIVTRKGFYGCTAYKDGCKQTFPGIFLKKKITASQVKLLCTKGQTNVIKGFVAKNGNKFNAALKLDQQKLVLDFANTPK
ncbi:topoisomerase C-terminal repeat-containing protein, partial [Microvirga sp. 3-52]|nr:topoisomerase C-terminal repeat-containing protein [Microvirga sp. 3-52]